MPPSYSLDPSIKIGLEDLDQIPNLDDNIKTNGFLLLNYGNFGHNIHEKRSDGGQRYLGIPGIFDNEKAFISRLFGFKTFIRVPLKPHKTGNFWLFYLTGLRCCLTVQTVLRLIILHEQMQVISHLLIMPVFLPVLCRSLSLRNF